MKFLLKFFVIAGMLLLAFSCSEDDPEHYLRFATAGDSLKVNSITIGDLSFSSPSTDLSYSTSYEKISSGQDYDIDYDMSCVMNKDSLLDTILFIGTINTSSYYHIDKFNAEGLNQWTLKVERVEIDGYDDTFNMTIESTLPMN